MSTEELRKAVDVLTDHIADLNRCIGVFHVHPALKPVADEFEKATKELAPVVNALRDKEAEIARLRAKTACTMGVGNGRGNLFVHGDFDSIKAAQSLVFRAERADALLRSCKAVCARVIDQDGGILGGIDFYSLNSGITAHLGAEHE